MFREREKLCLFYTLCMYIYIYIYMFREREREVVFFASSHPTLMSIIIEELKNKNVTILNANMVMTEGVSLEFKMVTFNCILLQMLQAYCSNAYGTLFLFLLTSIL